MGSYTKLNHLSPCPVLSREVNPSACGHERPLKKMPKTHIYLMANTISQHLRKQNSAFISIMKTLKKYSKFPRSTLQAIRRQTSSFVQESRFLTITIGKVGLVSAIGQRTDHFAFTLLSLQQIMLNAQKHLLLQYVPCLATPCVVAQGHILI